MLEITLAIAYSNVIFAWNYTYSSFKIKLSRKVFKQFYGKSDLGMCSTLLEDSPEMLLKTSNYIYAFGIQKYFVVNYDEV